MKTALLIMAMVAFLGCGRFQDHPKFKDGATVLYDVNGVTGTGTVVSSSPSTDGWYYVVDVGVDGAGERDRPSLHEKLLKRKK